MLLGQNKHSDRLLEILELGSKYPIREYQDIYLNSDGTEIILYTHSGGLARYHYWSDEDSGDECSCTGCIMTYQVFKHPNYLEDDDDTFNCGYAYVYYSVPDKYKDECRMMSQKEKSSTVLIS